VIELLKDFSDNVAAFTFHGHVTKTEVAPDFAGFDPGAVWADSKFGFGHYFDWDRAALVSDVEWVKHVAKFSEFLGFLWPGEYRAFPNAEADKAREWIAEVQ